MKSDREAAEAIYGAVAVPALSAPVEGAIADLELALLAGKIVAYAQGFSVMAAASAEFSWSLPLATVARIWRAGCIIRSQFLGEIAAAFEASTDTTNLLMTRAFQHTMAEAHPSLRRIVALSAEAALPAPALGAALGHFDGFRRARGTADLIQAQRDYFGAHGFERVDRKGAFHGPWKRQ
ncbi:6-phosphogluconate dehydrogenase [Mesorhizobium sp. J18]|nr:6-phosphogluconate dehydrogenase [Mesorhizobium sp. J18]